MFVNAIDGSHSARSFEPPSAQRRKEKLEMTWIRPFRYGFALVAMFAVASCSKPVPIYDFVDHAAEYKGRTIEVGPVYFAGPGQLPDARGEVAIFTWTSAKLKAELPKGLEVPNAGTSESLFLTLVCEQGDPKLGNKIVSVRRGK